MKLLELECPHCPHSMSLIGKELNKSGKVKSCPQCGGQFTFNLDYKKMAKIAIPIILVMVLIVTALTFPNKTSTITLLIMALPGAIFGYYKSMSLKPVDEKTST